MSESVPTASVVADVPCPFCACLCDDLKLTVSGGRIVAAANACPSARQQLLAPGRRRGENCRIAGGPASLQQSLQRAAEILLAARYPLFWGLRRASCEAQQAAVEIAERSRGAIDIAAHGSGERNLDTLQTVGEVSCSLGEIRSRADLVVVWNADPVADLPRFFERYAPQSLGQPGGCPLVVVDSRSTATAAIASQHLRIHPGSEFETATVLWALAKRLTLDPRQIERQTGVSLAQWQELAASMLRSHYGVLLDDGTDSHGTNSHRAIASPIAGLVRTLNERRRWVSLRLAKVSNTNGAEQVLGWRTGFSRAVDFSHGFPRYDPTAFAAESLLERGEVDAAILICDGPPVSLRHAAQSHLQQIPKVSIDWREPPAWPDADVTIRVAVPGVEAGGTMFRMDGVPLSLRPALAANTNAPADFEVLRMLQSALRPPGRS
ncbi:MAG TPA: hypothetical protein VHX65_14710 [Pirellulales bacterium]|nr:hypothetical protein [Pirellulales bacterium]